MGLNKPKDSLPIRGGGAQTVPFFLNKNKGAKGLAPPPPPPINKYNKGAAGGGQYRCRYVLYIENRQRFGPPPPPPPPQGGGGAEGYLFAPGRAP